jgi:hypothetical protein
VGAASSRDLSCLLARPLCHAIKDDAVIVRI